jgi:ABC-type Mn2+/Zn2+ transport system permease subunit
VIGVTAGFAAGYIGSLMVLEKMALVGDALSHIALPGLAIGILFNFYPFIGAFAFLFGSAVVIWYLRKVTRLSFETLVGTMFTLALAIGILIIPQVDLLEALFGDITNVVLIDAVLAVIFSAVAIIVTKIIYNRLVLGIISEELATSSRVNVSRMNLLYLIMVSLVVAIGIKIVGTMLVGFLVVTPAAAAKNISSNLLRYSVLSGAFGVVSASAGVLLSGSLNLPAGPLAVLSGMTIFLITVVIRWASK